MWTINFLPAKTTKTILPGTLYNKTWGISKCGTILLNFINDETAIKQSVGLILATERFRHLIFSFNYGSEFSKVIGKDYSNAVANLPTLISEALLSDSRIKDVKNFNFKKDQNTIHVDFTVVHDNGSFSTNITI